jgi:hypothetical protein
MKKSKIIEFQTILERRQNSGTKPIEVDPAFPSEAPEKAVEADKQRVWNADELNVALHTNICRTPNIQPATSKDFDSLIASLNPAPP